jgi:hypothetical protein
MTDPYVGSYLGDQISLWKNTQNVAKRIFGRNITFTLEKLLKIWETFAIVTQLPKVNNGPTGPMVLTFYYTKVRQNFKFDNLGCFINIVNTSQFLADTYTLLTYIPMKALPWRI